MPNVLVVEDDYSIADMLQEALEKNGYRVSSIARTVEEALISAKLDVPDFAVIDIRLANGGHGAEVGVRLRATTSAGILFSTGNTNNGALTKSDGDAVVIKPYKLNDVALGLTIIDQVRKFGRTDLPLPHNFRLLE